MNIAVILDYELQAGGGFQQSISTSVILNKYKNEKYNFIFLTPLKKNQDILRNYGIHAKHIHISFFNRFVSYFRRNYLIGKAIREFKIFQYAKLDRYLLNLDVDVIYFLAPSWLALQVEAHKYLFTVWDLCHRDFMEFPEVYNFREFEVRERLFHAVLPKAIAVIVDSELGKENIIRRYGIDKRRVVSLPFLPSNTVKISEETYAANDIDVKHKYHIPGEYLFYPAQFWSHKNHRYILDALRKLKEKHGKIINAVFCGSDKGNLNFILKKAKEYQIHDQIFYIGYADTAEIPYLYRQSIALVMPTYFGPTNIPPLEAFALGCPVCYPHLPGLEDQMKDAVFLMDIENPDSLVEILLKIDKDRSLVNEKITRGKRILEKWNEIDFWNGLKNIFDEYEIKLKCWK
ncbi:MAG: glycosyltransferase family 1 protein [Candidatus Brocadia sp.]|nr:hypothetical protein [Candidatus Brocadia fulgida]MCC6326696.1 glycosyltransferase [Candidatus Brocadia sp.]MCE7911311.1 glycosyltransferase [Candidatus Brocadia sp. AMX3]MDG5996238.1 glycosyltransferase [Candidatus Brocadia sp.]RIK01941.1 MAG: glycosyltransferase family 1 protein [Candidatus Brocadia sp.]